MRNFISIAAASIFIVGCNQSTSPEAPSTSNEDKESINLDRTTESLSVLLSDGSFSTIQIERLDSTTGLYEGDIVIQLKNASTNHIELSDLKKATGNVSLTAGRWPNGIVPYTKFSPGTFGQRLSDWITLTNAINYWNTLSNRTGITFVPRNSAVHTDYVHFNYDNAQCNSPVGRIGGRQITNVGPGCGEAGKRSRGMIHEMGHIVGLFHEHQRTDRNQNITVTGNTKADEANFGLKGTINGSYDGTSIMHYDATTPGNCFDVDHNNICNSSDIYMTSGAVTINPGNTLSEGDITAVRFLYP